MPRETAGIKPGNFYMTCRSIVMPSAYDRFDDSLGLYCHAEVS